MLIPAAQPQTGLKARRFTERVKTNAASPVVWHPRETDCSIHLKLRKNRSQSLTSDF